MTEATAQSRLDQLLERLLIAAEAALATGEFDAARHGEEVRAVDAENERAAQVLQRARAQHRAETQCLLGLPLIGGSHRSVALLAGASSTTAAKAFTDSGILEGPLRLIGSCDAFDGDSAQTW